MNRKKLQASSADEIAIEYYDQVCREKYQLARRLALVQGLEIGLVLTESDDEFLNRLSKHPRQFHPTSVDAVTPTLTKSAVSVLVTLNKHHPQLLTQYDLKVSRDTARKVLTELKSCGYAEQPKGPRKGWTVTAVGRAIANELLAKK